ncbi:type VI secretion system tip protein TssI/VgrG [Sorangium sp. So ce375]|uniref:type VI secretion system Vgr family protein n=1 Tax=Sorangium sp. So ce375 TaxID=3133306 RepID=UPI003F5C9D03
MAPPLVRARLTIDGLKTSLEVKELAGAEAISELYAFDITVECADTNLDLDALVAESAVLTLDHGASARHLHGIVSRLEQVLTLEHRAAYRATLVPEVWLLDQRYDCRIFQGVTTAEVIERVLKLGGVRRFEMVLQRSYEARDVCVQYRESDWAFLSRLMEEEGIFYYFEHTDAGATLMISDTAQVHAPISPKELRYRAVTGALHTGEGIDSFRFAQRVRPGKVTTRDVPFENPASVVDTAAEKGRHTDLAVFAYPASPAAEIRLDALQATASVGQGEACTVRLAPGARFRIEDHPRESFNAEYLVTRLQHAARLDSKEGYRCTFECVPAGVAFRPPCRTQKPRIAGPQAATVVGTQGAEIETDSDGRVRVRLHWDRNGNASDNACWVHVAQMASGAGYGAMHIPRVGSAVLVEFLDGDPDRPIVTGRVYTVVSPYPYALPAEKTKSTLRTRTTPGGGGYNELRFEDQSGREEVYLRAQRDLKVDALNDARHTVGGDDALAVTGDHTKTIGGAETVTIAGARAVTVGAAETRTVAADQTTSVGADSWLSVAGDHTASVFGDRRDVVAGDRSACVGGDESVMVSGDRTVTVTGAHAISSLDDESRRVAGNLTLSVGGTMQQVVDGHCTLSASSLEWAVTDGALEMTCAGEVRVESEQEVQIGGPDLALFADSTIRIRAQKKIVLEIGNATDAEGKSAKIEITSDGIYVTNGSATEKLDGGTVRLNC